MNRFRLFLSSPGDVGKERKHMSQIVTDVNEENGAYMDYRIELIDWETHAVPQAGSPQDAINEQLGDYEIFVGIMWRRFGTPTQRAGSGTEEEFRIAYNRWKNNNSLPIMFYFCERPFMPKDLQEWDQMRNVLLFRKELEQKIFSWTYNSNKEFVRTIRKHLCKRCSKMVSDLKSQIISKAVPDDALIFELRKLWKHMDPSLQKAFNVAYNENRFSGDAGIKTQDLFSALARVTPESIQPIIDDIPEPARPKPTEGNIVDSTYLLNERPWLSGCISSSVHRLNNNLPRGRKLSSADVFVDIAKHGSGESVRLLREHKVGPNEIERIISRKNLDIVNT